MAVELGTPVQPPFERFGRAFSAEDLQLYYQIALLGSRDLEFAPEAKIGFDMTLIRLASFEPAASDDGIQPPEESRGGEAPQPQEPATATEEQAAPADAEPAQSGEVDGDWHEIVAQVMPAASVTASE